MRARPYRHTLPMNKLIVHIDRKEGMSEKDFHDHWDEEHVPIVEETVRKDET